jgi:hypothetical protein
MKNYTVEFIYPGATKPVQRGWKEGYKLNEAVEAILDYHYGKMRSVGTIRFDNKEVVPEHREAILSIAERWHRILQLEKDLNPGEARRRKKHASVA